MRPDSMLGSGELAETASPPAFVVVDEGVAAGVSSGSPQSARALRHEHTAAAGNDAIVVDRSPRTRSCEVEVEGPAAHCQARDVRAVHARCHPFGMLAGLLHW